MVASSMGHHVRFLRHLGLSASTSEATFTAIVSCADPIDHSGGHITNDER
jgi:hypothetical protein